ncbi:MAG TPA: hypothetical protein VKT78_02420 [Fimbriimonadaceae bacterium]|nr:hypothetical protein [Fimbriimonadaceae bacterium]
MNTRLLFAGIALTGIVFAPAAGRQTPAFTDADRDRVLAFWKPDDRYRVAPADKQEVRLTVAGSQWLFAYGHIKGSGKLIPTVDAKPGGAPQAWEDWINAKVAFDRAQAQAGIDGDGDGGSKQTPAPDPGPCPDDLVAQIGEPPKLAEACTPQTYAIRFDDVTVNYTDHVKVRPRYAYYRFAEGVADGGVAMRNVSPDRLDHLFRLAGVDVSAANVMKAVSALEGGFESVNTYDTGFVSVGFIQFASLKAGAGSLGGMMLHYKNADPTDFDRDFRQYGVDVTTTGTLAVLDPATGHEFQGPDANAKVIADKRLIAVFGHAGARSDAFIAAQIAAAKDQFYPDADSITVTLGGQPTTVKVADLFPSEAGMATLMDRKVNTGKLDPLAAVVQRVADAHSVTALVDLVQYEADIIRQLKYRRDYLADATLSQPGGENATTSRHGGHRGS